MKSTTRKAPRSAAQKAATKRMIAANKRSAPKKHAKHNAANSTFAVVMPINESRGQVLSLHRTAEHAQAAIDRTIRALRRKSGYADAWLDRVVVRVPAGTSVRANIARR